MNEVKVINKTMDLADLNSDEARAVIKELNNLVKSLKEKGLRVSSWYGCFDLKEYPRPSERINRGYGYTSLDDSADDRNFPWFLYWEIVWVFLNNKFEEHCKVLDLGGSSSLFSYYLASKGLNVVTVDLQEGLVENANVVAREMDWKLKNYVMDMRDLNFDCKFEHITSICVYEHIPMYDRLEINRIIKNLLVSGGTFSITFDYRNPSRLAQINTPYDIYEQFVKPSGLSIRGNQRFVDTRKSYLLHPFYHPRVGQMYKIKAVLKGQFSLWEYFKTKETNDYTFGALFLRKAQ